MDHLKPTNGRSCSACLVTHAAMKIGKKLYWDLKKEVFNGNVEANKLLFKTATASIRHQLCC